MRRKFSLLVSLVLFIYGCTVLEQSGYGVFLHNGGLHTELYLHHGAPSLVDIRKFQRTSAARPRLVIAQPDIDLPSFELRRLLTQQVLPYQILTQDSARVEITPETGLEVGIYCLVEVIDYLSVLEHPYWCFRVGSWAGDPLDAGQADAILRFYAWLTAGELESAFWDFTCSGYFQLEANFNPFQDEWVEIASRDLTQVSRMAPAEDGAFDYRLKFAAFPRAGWQGRAEAVTVRYRQVNGGWCLSDLE